jgi:hypothetical protein
MLGVEIAKPLTTPEKISTWSKDNPVDSIHILIRSGADDKEDITANKLEPK